MQHFRLNLNQLKSCECDRDNALRKVISFCWDHSWALNELNWKSRVYFGTILCATHTSQHPPTCWQSELHADLNSPWLPNRLACCMSVWPFPTIIQSCIQKLHLLMCAHQRCQHKHTHAHLQAHNKNWIADWWTVFLSLSLPPPLHLCIHLKKAHDTKGLLSHTRLLTTGSPCAENLYPLIQTDLFRLIGIWHYAMALIRCPHKTHALALGTSLTVNLACFPPI